jgi:hypothetical protein
MTMKKGRTFELQVKAMLEDELNRGKLNISPQGAKVFWQKGYWSRDRDKPIIVDVSIEVYREGADAPYLVWVWECKDYGGLVPVDDIEEFHAKLEQIGLHRTKGTVVCKNGFQSRARKYAESKGISLVRILPDGSMIRIMEMVRTISRSEVEMGLSEPETENLTSMFYGLSSSGLGVETMSDFISIEMNAIRSLGESD